MYTKEKLEMYVTTSMIKVTFKNEKCLAGTFLAKLKQ